MICKYCKKEIYLYHATAYNTTYHHKDSQSEFCDGTRQIGKPVEGLKTEEPDEVGDWDFHCLLQRNVPMIEIVPFDDTQNEKAKTISIEGYKRIASHINPSGGLCILFERISE